ncbi:MAG: hypothetical protein QNJ81_06795 [Acidimicrobiia bacterium]|nr:hypothetical protein [Acidimicrobiia bacterium]
MADQLYYTIIVVRTGKGQGRLELHNSLKRKDVAKGRPRCRAKAVDFRDKESYRAAIAKIQAWRTEMNLRFFGKEVEPERLTYYD